MNTTSQSTDSKCARLESATYTLAEAAALWGISYTCAHEAVQAGNLPVTPLRIGRKYLFPRVLVDRTLGIEERPDAA